LASLELELNRLNVSYREQQKMKSSGTHKSGLVCRQRLGLIKR